MAFVNQVTRRGFASSPKMAAKINEVVIIGGGLMGAGIAQVRGSNFELWSTVPMLRGNKSPAVTIRVR